MSNRPGIELSTVQIIASMGAAVTGAVLTSYLGDGGTILGTAVGSGVSTTGFAIYKHYLSRTKEKVAPVIVEHARQWSPTGQTSSRAAGAQQTPRDNAQTRTDIGQTRADLGQTRNDSRQTRPDISQTRNDLTQTQRDLGQTRSGNGQGWYTDGQTRRDAGPADTRTAQFGTVRMGSTGGNGPGGSGGSNGPNEGGRHGRGTPGSGGGRGLRGRPRWVITAATSLAVFLVAMLVITLIEFGTGKPIDASVWGRNDTGTTLGNVTGGSTTTGSSKNTVQPTTSATPSQSASPGVNGTGQPTSGATPTPTPSTVPSVGATNPAPTAPATTGATPPGQAGHGRGQ